MLIERLIPCLLLQSGGLYKTVRFKAPTYLGDPVNAVKIFSDKEADEIVVIDIGATAAGQGPNFDLIADIAVQAYMPVCYGGGVSSLAQMERLFKLGVEKVMLSSHALTNPDLVSTAAKHFGSQSIVVCLDYRKPFLSNHNALYSHRGHQRLAEPLQAAARRFEALGVGEIVLNNIDRDGTMKGYDHALISEIASLLSIPVISLGGAKSLDDMRHALKSSGAAGAAAGSLFSFRWPERAVLINYPKDRPAFRP